MMRKWVPALLAVLMMSCQEQAPRPGPETSALPDFPLAVYQQAPTESVYRIDSGHSLVQIIVRRGGKLARFGHDHVVSTGRIEGYLIRPVDDPAASRADLRLDLKTLIVDKPELRQQHQMDTQPTPEDIDKTTENMQLKVLQSDTWQQAHLHIAGVSGSPEILRAELTITLHGESHSFPIMINLEDQDSGKLVADGSFSLLQSDYGIEPFSVLGGGLQVLDEVQIIYHLEALHYLWPASNQPK